MGIHGDPTANAAVGSVMKEWRRLEKLALSLRKTNRALTPEERKMFTGIYERLLSDSVPELEKTDEGK